MVLSSNNDISQITQDKECIFLAGSMAKEPEVNWRQTVIDNLEENYHFLDPTNSNHNSLSDAEMHEHVMWEFEGMRIADYILINFISDSLSPISLVELGLHTATDKLIVVCPKEFYKWSYIETLCKEHNTPIFNRLEEVINGDMELIFNTKKQEI